MRSPAARRIAAAWKEASPDNFQGVADFSASLRKGAYSLTLFINNAFDERAQSGRYANCAYDTCGPNPYYVPLLPRMYGLKFTQEF